MNEDDSHEGDDIMLHSLPLALTSTTDLLY